MHLIHVLTHRIFETDSPDSPIFDQKASFTKMWKKSSNHRWFRPTYAKILAFSPTRVRSFDRLLTTNLTVYGILRGFCQKSTKWPVSPSKKQLVIFVFPCRVFLHGFAYVRNVGPYFYFRSLYQTNLRKRWETPSLWAFAEQKRMSSHDSIVWPINVREFFPIMQSGLNLNGVQNTCTTSSPQHTNAAPLHPANCQFIEQSH